jgi:ATP synthase protein I
LSEVPKPESGESEASRRREVAIQLAALGLEFSGSVIGGLIIGYYLDEWLGTGPWLLIVFTFAGMGSAIVRMVTLTRRFDRLRREREAHERQR